jgi:hypothetical protein
VRLGRDRAVGHRAGGEPAHDAGHRLDLVDRYRSPGGQPLGTPRGDGVVNAAYAQQAAQGHQPRRLVVHQLGVIGEDVLAPAPGRVLELEHGLRVEQVRFPFAPPLVLPAGFQPPVRGPRPARREGPGVARGRLGGQLVEAHPGQAGRRPGEAGPDDLVADPDRLEDLGAGVGGDRGHAHLGHDLQQALAERLDEVGPGLAGGHPLENAGPGQVLDRLDGQVGTDARGAVPDQQRDVVALAGIARGHDQPDPGPGPLPDQVVVHRAGEQQ